jgi:hypothetical protein
MEECTVTRWRRSRRLWAVEQVVEDRFLECREVFRGYRLTWRMSQIYEVWLVVKAILKQLLVVGCRCRKLR